MYCSERDGDKEEKEQRAGSENMAGTDDTDFAKICLEVRGKGLLLSPPPPV